jgi:crotonobetainyl-CoA:carnitine CoA-transferase CaiB-like acyl-CoA transferase
MHALGGIKVLDLSRVLAGPWCTQTLADLGADVWKVEQPGTGDDTRTWLTPDIEGESTYFLCANRSKRSIAIDLKHPKGQALVRKMAMEADVLVENFRSGTVEKFGLDFATLSELNPRLIYCSISGYGRTGPRAQEAGYDVAIQAECGLMAATGEPDGVPVKVGVPIVDVVTGMAAVQAILAALIARGRTGQGQWIDMGLQDCGTSLLANIASAYLATGIAPRRFGNAHSTIVPYQTFATADNYIVIAVGNDRQFRNLCAAIGRPDLGEDARFTTNSLRVTHREECVAALVPPLRQRTTADWLTAFDTVGVPSGAVRSVSQVFDSPESIARDYCAVVPDSRHGKVRIPASPLKLSLTPVRAPVSPPRLGEHTDELLHEILGLKADDITLLRAEGAVA